MKTTPLLHPMMLIVCLAAATLAAQSRKAENASPATPLSLKDSRPYLHDGRCLKLGDTMEFFNLVLQTGLTAQEKKDPAGFLRCL